MLLASLKHEYPLFKDALHFAAHSHHPRLWVTHNAILQCWDDAATMLDAKWGHIFGKVIPEAQRNVAELLRYRYPDNIAFAPNTHEFVARILSAFSPKKPLRVLTTDSEFYSFARQMQRTAERGNVTVTRVPVAPYRTFAERFAHMAHSQDFDLIFFSQTFFDSGFRIKERELEHIVACAIPRGATIVIDGYHGFCAVPTSLETIGDRVFYLAGGYKYAGWGEGACFLCVPPHCKLEPENTGWFATYDSLHDGINGDKTKYREDGFRFWGSTFDPAGLYRLNAVCAWLREKGISVEMIHRHVQELQNYFLNALPSGGTQAFRKDNLVIPDRGSRGNFLSFDLGSTQAAQAAVLALAHRGVIVDSRGSYVRIGFGMYHDVMDVAKLLDIIWTLDKENSHE